MVIMYSQFVRSSPVFLIHGIGHAHIAKQANRQLPPLPVQQFNHNRVSFGKA